MLELGFSTISSAKAQGYPYSIKQNMWFYIQELKQNIYMNYISKTRSLE